MRQPRGTHVLDAQRALLAKGVLQYVPSLSVSVQDALFSFWRLPLAARSEISSVLPSIVLDASPVRARVDWERLAHCIRASTEDGAAANPMEIAWAFALHAEAAVTTTLLAMKPRIQCDLRVTHGEHVAMLLGLLRDESGEFYLVFVVLITVLEKALYDLYHRYQERSSAEASKSKKRKNMILRDLLHSETIAHALPDGLLLLLQILFLPSGLNLRNLVWHGFMIPAEFPKCFGCLVVVLLMALPQVELALVLSLPPAAVATVEEVIATDSEQLFDVHSYDDRFVIRDDALRCKLQALSRRLSAAGDATCSDEEAHHEDLFNSITMDSSRFVPVGRQQLVRKAFRALIERGDELWFLFALLPVLEHALRIKFIEVNREKWGISNEYGAAQIDAYYSTLDGFGQREKHQVLLHSHVVVVESGDDERASDVRSYPGQVSCLNQLYSALPSAALAVCLDLFMMSSGPNLRAKLCHGEADLSTLLRDPSPSYPTVSIATQLVVLAWWSICRDACAFPSTDSKSTRTLAETFEKSYTSSFHPFHQLQRALASALAVAKQFGSLRERYARFQLALVDNGSEPMVWVAFPAASEATDVGGSEFGVVEKASRIGDFRPLLLECDGPFAWSDSGGSTSLLFDAQRKAPSKGSFPELLVRLCAKLREVVAKLRHHYEAQHARSRLERHSAFLGLLDPAALPESHHADMGSSNTQLFAKDPGVDSYLLALSDEDGLSVAACMLEVVASAQRAYSSFASRHVDLQQLIASGRARTNHRRSFLNSVFFLPIFESVQALSLSLVEHQLLHLRSLAMRAHSGSLAAYQPCSHARSFELLQRKLLLFITAFEGCAGGSSDSSAQKSAEKALLLALQFLDSKAMQTVLSP